MRGELVYAMATKLVRTSRKQRRLIVGAKADRAGEILKGGGRVNEDCLSQNQLINFILRDPNVCGI